MALLDRFLPTAENGLPEADFAAALMLASRGDISLAQVKTFFGLDASDDLELNQMASNYQAAPDDGSINSKLAYLVAVRWILNLLKSGTINQAQARTFLGL